MNMVSPDSLGWVRRMAHDKQLFGLVAIDYELYSTQNRLLWLCRLGRLQVGCSAVFEMRSPRDYAHGTTHHTPEKLQFKSLLRTAVLLVKGDPSFFWP